MSVRTSVEAELTRRNRVALFHNTSVDLQTACEMTDQSIDCTLLLEAGVREVNCVAAGVGPRFLFHHGARSARTLRDFGFDAVSLCEARVCNEAVLAYGADEVVAAFVTTAADAVCVAGKQAMYTLGLTVVDLLKLCAGFPGEALEVLAQLPRGLALEGVSCNVVLDTGLRATALATVGYGLATIVAHTRPSADELRKLGFAPDGLAIGGRRV